MKFLTLLSLATAGSALVLPEASVFEQLDVNGNAPVDRHSSLISKLTNYLDHLPSRFTKVASKGCHEAHKSVDDAVNRASELGHYATDKLEDLKEHYNEHHFAGDAWLKAFDEDREHPPHDRPPHHGPPGHERPPHHRRPKHDQTVYELIASSKYTTKLAELVNEFPDIVEALNNTDGGDVTVFAPVDSAFEKIPEHAHKPSKEILEKVLTYHVVPGLRSAKTVLTSRTLPTFFKSKALGDRPQRLSVNLGLKGLTVNFYSRAIAVDIFGTNGVIHAVDSLLIPPPSALTVLDILPGEFSTLTLALERTGLHDVLNNTAHAGSTFFAPTNGAFARLGARANALLFSKYGQKYLAALLKYHVVFDQTLYSDAYYGPDEDSKTTRTAHYELPTLLEGRTLSVDVARYLKRFVEVKINGFNRAAVVDGIVRDGVIHIPQSVIIPPRNQGSEVQYWDGESELTEEDLKERLEPFIETEYADDL